MDRRSFLKLFAAAGAALALPIKWVTEPRNRTIRIAAFNSSHESKSRADVVCTGHNDGTTIQNAINRLADGDMFLMDGGTFYLDRSIIVPERAWITNCIFVGPHPSAPVIRVNQAGMHWSHEVVA